MQKFRDVLSRWERKELSALEAALPGPLRGGRAGRTDRPEARVKVHEYPDGMLAVFHGPRLLARYDAAGQALNDELKAAA
jgi:hypothetical protein